MPKLFGREVPPVVLVGVTILAVYLVAGALQPPDVAPTKPKSKAVAKKSTVDVEYTGTDYTAQFASLSGSTPKDAFRPLITKAVGGSNPLNPSIDNFTYSGMALLNGQPNGLLENGTTGEGDFVKPGEHWHQQWLVVSVTPDQIDLKNDVGDDTILKVGASAAKEAAAATVNTGGANTPFNPAMIGQIGSPDISIQPDAANPMPQQNNNGRRRGRRGGGGGQGGMNNGGN